MENIYEKIIVSKNKPLFESKISNDNHKIFYKYTSKNYYKYIYDLLNSLCTKSPYENRTLIFHISFYFILKILYKCENTPYLTNLDLMVFNCFSLGLKTSGKQKEFPTINRLKKIYEEKYCNYKNEEIYTGEIICLKLLNYNINILTAYEYIIYLTQKDSKLKDLSLVNLKYLMINNINQFIYKSSFDLAKECIQTIQENIIIQEPKIIKKKIVSSNAFKRSPKIKKYLSTDRLVTSIAENPKYNNQITNNDFQIQIGAIKINNLNKFNLDLKESNINHSNLNIKNSADRVYCKKNCKNIHQNSSNSIITEFNIFNNNDNDKNELINFKINKIIGNNYINQNNSSYTNYFKINKSSTKTKKKIYINNYNVGYNRNQYKIFDMNNTQHFKKKNLYNNENTSKENNMNAINLSNEKKDFYDEKNFDYTGTFYNPFIKGPNTGILTKSINLGALNKNNNKNTNFQRYNMTMKKNDYHEKLKNSNNYFNNINCSQEGNISSNKILKKYYIRW